MSKPIPEAVDRREFLHRWMRRGLLGALSVAGLTLVVRGQTCTRGGVCGGCAVLSQCGLPPAVDYRRLKAKDLP
jgi:hypothetical protein